MKWNLRNAGPAERVFSEAPFQENPRSYGPRSLVSLNTPRRGSYVFASDTMDVLKNFPLVWCSTCGKTQRMIFDVLLAGGKNDHDAADIVCGHCKSIIATLRAPAQHVNLPSCRCYARLLIHLVFRPFPTQALTLPSKQDRSSGSRSILGLFNRLSAVREKYS
jgi:hypothetical protein